MTTFRLIVAGMIFAVGVDATYNGRQITQMSSSELHDAIQQVSTAISNYEAKIQEQQQTLEVLQARAQIFDGPGSTAGGQPDPAAEYNPGADVRPVERPKTEGFSAGFRNFLDMPSTGGRFPGDPSIYPPEMQDRLTASSPGMTVRSIQPDGDYFLIEGRRKISSAPLGEFTTELIIKKKDETGFTVTALDPEYYQKVRYRITRADPPADVQERYPGMLTDILLRLTHTPQYNTDPDLKKVENSVRDRLNTTTDKVKAIASFVNQNGKGDENFSLLSKYWSEDVSRRPLWKRMDLV